MQEEATEQPGARNLDPDRSPQSGTVWVTSRKPLRSLDSTYLSVKEGSELMFSQP